MSQFSIRPIREAGRLTRFSAAAALAACAMGELTSEATAQTDTASQAAAPQDGRTIYAQDFFSRFEPNTAEDILKVIPGVATILEDSSGNRQERGFGSAGARVLLNGRRFPGKANDLGANLARIPASAVQRIELISGAAGDISVQSDGLLVNVVLREGAGLKGSGSWEANLRFNDEGRTEFDGLINYSSSLNGVGYSLGLERNVWSPPNLGGGRWSNRFRDETYFYPNGGIQELRPQYWERDHDKWILTGGLNYDFVRGDRVQLNLFYQTLQIGIADQTDFTRFDQSGTVTLEATDNHVREIDLRETLELGGEYDAPLAGGSVHALAIFRREKSPSLDFRNRTTAGAVAEISRSLSQVDEGEDILRASWLRPLGDAHSIEFGAEGARNTLDQNLRVFFDTDADMLVEEVNIPTADASVEETRAELFVTHRYTPANGFSLDSSLTYETSAISNNYPFSPDRDLSFWKPRVDARYRIDPENQVRLLIERSVSQLDFENFVPSFDFIDDEIDAGNPGIEPEKTWTYELGYERRLPNDGGLIEARVYHQQITDAIDKVPLIDGAGAFFSAEGNLPEATITGAEIESSLRLTPIALPDAVLSLRYRWQESETTDPFTGEKRRLQDDFGDNYEISYRHDLTAAGFSYGFTYNRPGRALIRSDLFVRQYFKIDPTLTAFMEKRLSGGMTLRIDAQNLTGSPERQLRMFYADNAFSPDLRRYDQWKEERDLRIRIGLRGSF